MNGKRRAEPDVYLTRLKDLFAEKAETTNYTVEGLLSTGGFSVGAGRPKVGKSTVARVAAKAVSCGEPFLGRNTARGPVIYLALEEKRSEVSRHFKDMGCSGDEPIRILTSAAPSIANLRAAAERIKPALIIIDPLFRFSRVADTNNYAKMIQALEPILRLARETGTHVLAIHHLGKGRKAGGDAILGSTAIFGTVDTALLMNRTDQYRTIQTFQRYGVDLEETVLRFNEDTRMVTLGETREKEDQSRVGRSIEDYLRRQSSGVTEAVVDEEVGGRRQLRKRTLRRLVEEKRIERTGAGTKGDPFIYRIISGSGPYGRNQGTRIESAGPNPGNQSGNSGSLNNECKDSGSLEEPI